MSRLILSKLAIGEMLSTLKLVCEAKETGLSVAEDRSCPDKANLKTEETDSLSLIFKCSNSQALLVPD